MDRKIGIISTVLVAVLLISVVVVVAIMPNDSDEKVVWRAAYYDGYRIDGSRITMDIEVQGAEVMSQEDITITKQKDSSFVTAKYHGMNYVGIYKDGYMELKGYDGKYESIFYGIVNPDNSKEMFVIYIDINPKDLMDKTGSIYSCMYTADGHVPDFGFVKSMYSGWSCKAAYEMGYENGSPYKAYKALTGTSIEFDNYDSRSGLFKGSYMGDEEKELDFFGVVVPYAMAGKIGCNAMVLDEEYDVWQCFYGKTQGGKDQMTMMCTWGAIGSSGFGKAVYRIYSDDSNVTLPESKYDITGTWKEVSTNGILSDGKAFTEPTGLSFTLYNAEKDGVLYAGTGHVAQFKGFVSGYFAPGSDWVYVRVTIDDMDDHADQYNYCAAKVVNEGGKLHLELYQSFYLDGKYIATLSTFEKQ